MQGLHCKNPVAVGNRLTNPFQRRAVLPLRSRPLCPVSSSVVSVLLVLAQTCPHLLMALGQCARSTASSSIFRHFISDCVKHSFTMRCSFSSTRAHSPLGSSTAAGGGVLRQWACRSVVVPSRQSRSFRQAFLRLTAVYWDPHGVAACPNYPPELCIDFVANLAA